MWLEIFASAPGKLTQFSLYHGHWSIKEIQEIALQSASNLFCAIFAILYSHSVLKFSQKYHLSSKIWPNLIFELLP